MTNDEWDVHLVSRIKDLFWDRMQFSEFETWFHEWGADKATPLTISVRAALTEYKLGWSDKFLERLGVLLNERRNRTI